MVETVRPPMVHRASEDQSSQSSGTERHDVTVGKFKSESRWFIGVGLVSTPKGYFFQIISLVNEKYYIISRLKTRK